MAFDADLSSTTNQLWLHKLFHLSNPEWSLFVKEIKSSQFIGLLGGLTAKTYTQDFQQSLDENMSSVTATYSFKEKQK